MCSLGGTWSDLEVNWKSIPASEMDTALAKMRVRSQAVQGLQDHPSLLLESAFKNRLHTVRRGWLQNERKRVRAIHAGIEPPRLEQGASHTKTAPNNPADSRISNVVPDSGMARPDEPDSTEIDYLGKIIQGRRVNDPSDL